MRTTCTTICIACLAAMPVTALAQANTEPSQSSLPSVHLPPELDQVLQDYESAWKARDAAGLAELFAEDGFVMSPGREPVRGRAAIRERYAESGGPLVLRALAYSTADSVGYIIGAFARQPSDPDTGKFILTLRRDTDDRWLITADMDNGNSRN